MRFPAGPVATGWAVRRARSTYLSITAVRTGQGLPGHPVLSRGCRRGEPMCQITLRIPGAAYATSDQNRSGPAAGDGADRPSHRVESHTVDEVRPHPGARCLSRRPQVLEVERPPPRPRSNGVRVSSSAVSIWGGFIMTREETNREDQGLLSRRAVLLGLGAVAGAAAFAPRVVGAQAPPGGPAAPPSTVTNPPRDFSPTGAPTTYFTDPDILTVDPLFNQYAQPTRRSSACGPARCGARDRRGTGRGDI